MSQKKTQQRMFGPVAVVAAEFVGLREKSAMAATAALDQRDVGIRDDFVAAFGRQADERVVQRMQNQRRHGNAIEHTRSSSAVIVVIGAGEPGVQRSNSIVKLAQGMDSDGAVSIIGTRKENRFATEAP